MTDTVVGGEPIAEPLWTAVTAIVIGAAIWWWHWLSNGLRANRTPIWRGYVILVGVFGGLLATLISGTIVLFRVLQWFLTDTGTSAASHFEDATWATGVALVGIAVWIYHRAVLSDDAEQRTHVHQVYDYLVSGLALATVAGALTTLVVALFTVMSPSDAAGDGASDRDIVLLAVSLLVVGLPLWAVAWRRAQHAVAADRKAEIAAAPRRVYLFGVLGVSGAVAFGALTRFAFVVFEFLLDERSGGSVVEDLRIPVGLLITAGAIASYHWVVYRAEREEKQRRPQRDIVLIWGGGDDRAIEELTNSTVRWMQRLDTSEISTDVGPIVSAIEASEGENIVVVVDDDRVEVIPVAG